LNTPSKFPDIVKIEPIIVPSFLFLFLERLIIVSFSWISSRKRVREFGLFKIPASSWLVYNILTSLIDSFSPVSFFLEFKRILIDIKFKSFSYSNVPMSLKFSIFLKIVGL